MTTAVITQSDLRQAKAVGVWILDKDSAFYLKRWRPGDELRAPKMVLKRDVLVNVEKVYRRGRAALLRYTDRSGKVWWSWIHATEYERKEKGPQ